MSTPKATYIQWKDACSEEAAELGRKVSLDSPLVILSEVGWLINETDEAVSIAMEIESDGTPSRWRLHIPKVNIIERIDFDIPRKAKRRKRA